MEQEIVDNITHPNTKVHEANADFLFFNPVNAY